MGAHWNITNIMEAVGLFEMLSKSIYCPFIKKIFFKRMSRDFPGGIVDKNPPANAGDTGLIPGLGGSHMPWSG